MCVCIFVWNRCEGGVDVARHSWKSGGGVQARFNVEGSGEPEVIANVVLNL